MSKFLIASAILLTVGATAATANPAHHPDGEIGAGAGGMMQGEMMKGGMMQGGMMQGGMAQGGMMQGGGMMGGGMMNPDMMIIMLDTDGNGSLSLEEFQAMHERMFRYLDANGDGSLDASELANHHGNSDAAAEQE